MGRKGILTTMAIVIVLVIVGSTLIYSDSWPPIYAVESESMEHSSSWAYNTINVGDIVLAKNIHGNPSNVVTYIQGKESGYQNYGNYGNVILYLSFTDQIIIHRAMFYLSWSNGSPVVSGYTGQSWITVNQSYILLDNASYNGRNLVVYLSNLQNVSGFITVGDYNLATSVLYNSTLNAYEAADQNVFGFSPVSAGDVIGVSFGQIPWFGLIKLNLMRISGGWSEFNQVPNNAYTFLGLSVAAIVILVLFPYGKVFGGKK